MATGPATRHGPDAGMGLAAAIAAGAATALTALAGAAVLAGAWLLASVAACAAILAWFLADLVFLAFLLTGARRLGKTALEARLWGLTASLALLPVLAAAGAGVLEVVRDSCVDRRIQFDNWGPVAPGRGAQVPDTEPARRTALVMAAMGLLLGAGHLALHEWTMAGLRGAIIARPLKPAWPRGSRVPGR